MWRTISGFFSRTSRAGGPAVTLIRTNFSMFRYLKHNSLGPGGPDANRTPRTDNCEILACKKAYKDTDGLRNHFTCNKMEANVQENFSSLNKRVDLCFIVVVFSLKSIMTHKQPTPWLTSNSRTFPGLCRSNALNFNDFKWEQGYIVRYIVKVFMCQTQL